MFTELELLNFQSHKNSVLELHPNVNVIVGETDSGKSAILRALYWVAFGKPSGESIRRWNVSKPTSVSITLEEGTTISKVRGSSENYYQMSDEIYKGFGRSVPDVIANALNVKPINFVRQLDPPFLFSMSAGEVASYLNELVNLDIIGRSLSNISRMVKQAEKDTQVHENSIVQFEKQLEELQWIPDAEEAIKELEHFDKIVRRRKRHYSELKESISDYQSANEKIKSFPDLHKAERLLDVAYKEYECVKNQRIRAKALRSAISEYNKAQEALDTQCNYSNAEKLILKIESIMQRQTDLQEKVSALKIVIDNVKASKKLLKNVCCDERQALLQFKKLMPMECPLCGHIQKQE